MTIVFLNDCTSAGKSSDRLPGQARGQIDLVHRGMRYDLEIDTTEATPASCAEAILVAMVAR